MAFLGCLVPLKHFEEIGFKPCEDLDISQRSGNMGEVLHKT